MQATQKHILFIASWYPSRNAPALGNFIQQHARAAALQNRISVIYASAEKNIAEGTTEVVETHSGNLSEYILYYGKIKSKLPLISKLRKRDAYRSAIRHGIEIAEKKNGTIDLIHVHVIWPAAVAVLPLLSKHKVPLLISEHWSGYLPEDGNYKGVVQKNISKQLADKSQHITVVSKRMEDAMRKHGLGKSFSILPNAVNTEIFKFSESVKDRKVFHLVHVSMLVDREKNVSGLLRVMKHISGNPDIVLNIIGDGPERSKLEQQANESGILNKTVFFKGLKSHEEIAEELKIADALIMFSNFEGMPVTIIEAQCCGLPVIATTTGSIPEMVNENQGILVDPGDEAGLENAILNLRKQYGNYVSKNISSAAIAKYSLAAIGKQLDELYRTILKENGR